MNYRSDYLNIHEKAYQRLRADGKSSWSDSNDIRERMTFYLETFNLHNLGAATKALVLGCGDGETSLALAQHGTRVTGVDISPAAVDWACEKARERGLDARFIERNVVTDVSSIEAFDVVIDDHCLHCIVGADRSAAFSFIKNNLRLGGILIVRTQCGDPPANASSEVIKSWDAKSRCQVHNGVAGRYFGLPEVLLQEFESANFHAKHSRVFEYESGWKMLEGVFIRN